MLCQRCGQTEATVFTTSITDDEMVKRALCESCYESEGLGLPFEMGKIAKAEPMGKIAKIDLELVKSALGGDFDLEAENRSCPHCGMTLAEFRKRRVVGCAHDYEIFGDELLELLRRLHAGPLHVGKLPQAIEMKRLRDHRVGQLREELARAVTGESYEEAARLRDRIRALEEPDGEID
jgi:protein arginine kinase activator